ncbi:GNAT family N-acetyltransferase [Ornithinibacillus gellani]|uniref:GNAT family N-acetyltransferase n=1 Tax=Ornithinibacillus gellani TaxID=2293253 RepID=UPI000F47D4A8|nr:GNAT family N-acetyltransferase [Ornithinibacillus gellani]TQS70583.1 GNAT family N-acetyltransferase [Ornithinibacillus gellani]
MEKIIRPTPWDKRTFLIDTYELTAANDEALAVADSLEGHFTVKVDPLMDTDALRRHGFYYTDSLIEPVCSRSDLRVFEQKGIMLSQDYNRAAILEIAEEVFVHGRFHRDSYIPNTLANERYMRWVEDLLDEKHIYALLYNGTLVGFYAFREDQVLLLGIKKEFQGKGLAKPFTSQGCFEQFKNDYKELKTSISAANVASLNLFYSLGFRLRKTVDVYHKLNGPAPKGTL